MDKLDEEKSDERSGKHSTALDPNLRTLVAVIVSTFLSAILIIVFILHFHSSINPNVEERSGTVDHLIK